MIVAMIIFSVGFLAGSSLAYFKLLKGMKVYQSKAQESIGKYDKKVQSHKRQVAFFKEFSHEALTPLHAILGLLEELAQGKLSNAQREQVIAIGVAAKKLHILLSNIFHYQKNDVDKNVQLSEAITNKIKILVCEDDPVCQKVTMALLSKIGIEAELAKDGQAAVDMLKSNYYHVVLMDLQTPTISGYEATEQIRNLNSASKQTTIIALTACANKEDRQKCIDVGMNDYLTKPINSMELLTALDRWLKPMAMSGILSHDSEHQDAA